MDFKVGAGQIRLVKGSVIEQSVDVIVNAANPSMRGGGGVDGAIHAAAGKELLRELQELVPNRARTSEPVFTGAYKLPQKGILHVAGPVWQGGGSNEKNLLAACYTNCLRIASERGFESIAFCGISTGIFRFPLSLASEIAVREAKGYLENGESTVREIVFAMFGEAEYGDYAKELSKQLGSA
jgi:O-acetyl-ADP-ribose deacetylase